MRIGFAGNTQFSSLILQHLLSSGYNVSLVITNKDTKSGRGKKLTKNPVKNLATHNNLNIYEPTILDNNAAQYIKKFNLTILIVVAYGKILPTQLLTIPTYGCINIHTSLLPKWRGAAPIERAIAAGDNKTGVSIIQINEKLDEGDILYTKECKISNEDTALEIYHKLNILSQQAMIHTLQNIKTIKASPQKGQSSYAKKLTKQEGLINWQDNASNIYNKIRAFCIYPNAYTYINDGMLLKIIKANIVNKPMQNIIQNTNQLIIPAKNGAISLLRVQLAGKKVVDIRDFNNGHTIKKLN